MKIAIHQLNFLARLKVLQKIAAADCWVVLDSVQFAQSEWQNRARLLATTARQNEFWLTLPVYRPSGISTLINEVVVKDLSRTLQRCRQSVHHAFRSAPYWTAVDDYWSEVEQSIQSDSLVDVVLPTMVIALRQFASLPTLVRGTAMRVDGKKSLLMANMCSALEASEYLADSGALSYLQVDDFNHIKVVWQDWRPPATPDSSIDWRNVSFINFLARYGAEALRSHLSSCVLGPAEALMRPLPQATKSEVSP